MLLSSARTCVRMLYLDDRTLALPWRLVYAQQVLGVDDSKTQDYHTLARAHFLSRMHTAKASTHTLTRSWTSMTPSRSTSARSVRQDAACACARVSANDGWAIEWADGVIEFLCTPLRICVFSNGGGNG